MAAFEMQEQRHFAIFIGLAAVEIGGQPVGSRRFPAHTKLEQRLGQKREGARILLGVHQAVERRQALEIAASLEILRGRCVGNVTVQARLHRFGRARHLKFCLSDYEHRSLHEAGVGNEGLTMNPERLRQSARFKELASFDCKIGPHMTGLVSHDFGPIWHDADRLHR